MFSGVLDREQILKFEQYVLKKTKSEYFVEIFELIDDLLKDNSQNPDFLSIAGVCYFRAGDFKKAYNFFKQVAYFDKSNTTNLSWLLSTCIKLSYNDEAEEYIHHVEVHDVLIAIMACAEFYFSQYNYQRALEFSKRAYEKEGNNADVILLLCKVLSACNENHDEIIGLLEKAKKIKNTDEIDQLLIKTLYKSDQFDKCIKVCKKILISKPNSISAQKAQEIINKIKRKQRPSFAELGPAKELKKGSASEKEHESALEEALQKLNQLIGLNNVKEQIVKIKKKIEYDRFRKEKLGIDFEDNPGYHFIFTGNPGTGKTTVARLLGEIFYHLGVLEKGHLVETDRSGIVGQFIGQTAQMTKEKIDESMGGILFIDEAYSLARASQGSNDFGPEAIDTLIKAVEDKRDKFIVILAGYKDEMNQLLKLNPGLASRFNKHIEFSDYTDEELLEIAISMAKSKHYNMSESAKKAFLEKVNREKVDEKFGNGRVVRNLMNDAFEEKADIENYEEINIEDLQTLTAKDFGVDLDADIVGKASKYLDELNSLIGLENVKSKINEIIKYVQYQKDNEKLGFEYKNPYMHMVFAGNPGTGKTTVALLVGKLLKSLGILKKGHLVLATRADLVSGYVGQTAMQTLDKVKEAYGGILFIDEAYSLASLSQNDYGKEAIDMLIKEMEDNRDKLVVILAGYTKRMEELMDMNPGFESRISHTILFEDYTPDQMLQIFQSMCLKQKYKADEETMRSLKQLFNHTYSKRDENFGNAREVRKLFEQMQLKLAVRVQSSNVPAKERRVFKVCDID